MTTLTPLQSFQLALQNESKSPRTIGAHCEAITGLAKLFPIAIDTITRDHVRMFLANPRWSKNTRLIRWKGLKAFFDFCVGDGILEASPVDGIDRPPAGPPRLAPKYDEADIELLLAAADERSCNGKAKWVALRDQAIILVLGTSPARISELCGLLVTDVNFNEKIMRFRHTKGGREYSAIIFPQTARALDRYLRARPFDVAALWVSRDGGLLDVHAVQQMLRRLKVKTGMAKALYAHAFRHNFGMRTVEWGPAVDETGKSMGHRSMKAAILYRQQAAEAAALDKIRKIAG